jgi:hypothetical protein
MEWEKNLDSGNFFSVTHRVGFFKACRGAGESRISGREIGEWEIEVSDSERMWERRIWRYGSSREAAVR